MAILNGFGRSLGDGIIGLQAAHAALGRGSLPPQPVLFRLTGLAGMVRQLYAAAEFCECRDLAWAHETPGSVVPATAGFGRTIDLRDFALDPAFRGVAMIDFFLGRLGVAPASVPSAARRNTWLRPRVAPRPPPLAPGYVLVCPRASMELRTMPEAVYETVLAQLTALGARVATQGEVPRGSAAFAIPPAVDLAQLCGWAAFAGLIVSTDTAMIHLADAFDRPCLAVFTTHRPEWRARDYAHCRPIFRPTGLPPALEFSRGPADLAAARAAWLDRPLDEGGAAWLTDAVADAVAQMGAADVRPGRP